MEIRERIEAVRELMRAKGIDAYLVPGTDPHQSEYLPDHWKRRDFVTGFTGSAGDAVITLDDAGLWTDGRYFLQAERQLRGTGVHLFRMGMPGVPSIQRFLVDRASEGDRVGVDPRVVSMQRASALEQALAERGARLKPIATNLVDRVWKSQPRLPRTPLRVQPTRFAGEGLAGKLKRVRAAMVDADVDALVVTALDAIMWTTNLRGRDVDFNPVAIAYLIVERDAATLFVDPVKVTPEVERHLGRRVAVRPYREAGAVLRELGRARRRVWVDGDGTSRWVVDRLRGASLHVAANPIAAMKARKNATEQEGMRAAHVRDGVAMVRFLRWLESEVRSGDVTELTAAATLEAIRAEGDHYQGPSFRTISGYAEHGAIIHYSVDESTDVVLQPRGIYLVDSGAQYTDGTTDITRTLCLGGRPTAAQKEQYTRVLMGHVELATARFPAGTRGLRLDTFARMHLWQAGLDYRHGTGHGVGAHLNVHEGPQSISPRCTGAALEAGNVLSNEPGYYEDGSHGIRIENLVLVVEDPEHSTAEQTWLRFDTLSLCPIDLRLVKPSLLSDAHRKWIDAYHRRVLRELSPHLGGNDRAWLKEKCRRIGT